MPVQSTATAKTRPGLRQGVNGEFSVFLDVIPGHEKALRETLEKYARDPNLISRIRGIGTLHEQRYVIFDDGKRVMFCSTFDGDWDKYVGDFAAVGVAYFNDILQHTEGYPGMITDPKSFEWLAQHQITATVYTRDYEATARDILKALHLNEVFQKLLDSPAAQQALANPVLKPLLDEAAA
jgi:hypothetical protein